MKKPTRQQISNALFYLAFAVLMFLAMTDLDEVFR